MKGPASLAVGAGLVVALSALTACRSPEDSREQELDRKLLGECDAGRCVEVNDDDRRAPLGVDVRRHPLGAGDFWSRPQHVVVCNILERPTATPGVRMITPVSPGDVLVLDGRVAKVEHCDKEYEDAGSGFDHSKAVLLVDPSAYAWLVPDPKHLFVPLDYAFATLDDICIAIRPPRPGPDTPSLESVSLDVWLGGYDCGHDPRYDVGHKDAHPTLRAGETFAWGTHTAEVIRIVNDQPPLRGWIELDVR